MDFFTKLKQYVTGLSIIVLGTATGFIISLVFYWCFLEPNPLTFLKVSLDKNIAAPGESVYFTTVGNKRGSMTYSCDTQGRIIFLSKDSKVWELFRTYGAINPGGVMAITRELIIPKDVPLGPANIYEVVNYKCNPLRSHTIFSDKVPIQVVSK